MTANRQSIIFKIKILTAILLICTGMLYGMQVNAAGKVKISKTSLLLLEGKTKKLQIKNTKKKVKWSSTNEKVATVTAKGKVKAISSGTCTIKAKVNNKIFRCTVTVCEDKKTLKYHNLQQTYNPLKNQNRILLAGSSSIRRWESADLAFSPYKVLNMGIGGSTIQQWLKWYKKLIVAYNPRAVILYPGAGNSLFRGNSVEEITQNVYKLLTKLHKELPDVPIYYISVFQNLKMKPKTKISRATCNEIIREYCEKIENVYYIDVASYLAEDGIPLEGVISSDRVHLSQMGYLIWNATIVPEVKNNLRNLKINALRQ